MDFVAIDVETANADMASICQVGVARFSGGLLAHEWATLIDPEDDFDPVNISIHGISPEDVAGQPTLPQLAQDLRALLEDSITVCHTHFDRLAVSKAFARYNLPPIRTTWLDSARVARRTWPDCAWRGYGLANLCSKIGYTFQHHDALEDAKAAGQVLIAAIHRSGLGIEAWLDRVNLPIDLARTTNHVTRDGNRDGDFYGEVLVFTGTLELPRAEAADLASQIGCQVASSVTKKTTLLVVGDQDIKKLAGHDKSTKHRKAEELIAEGHPIRIICEQDFKLLVQSAGSTVSA